MVYEMECPRIGMIFEIQIRVQFSFTFRLINFAYKAIVFVYHWVDNFIPSRSPFPIHPSYLGVNCPLPKLFDVVDRCPELLPEEEVLVATMAVSPKAAAALAEEMGLGDCGQALLDEDGGLFFHG